jgi:hypothetical protein
VVLSRDRKEIEFREAPDDIAGFFTVYRPAYPVRSLLGTLGPS